MKLKIWTLEEWNHWSDHPSWECSSYATTMYLTRQEAIDAADAKNAEVAQKNERVVEGREEWKRRRAEVLAERHAVIKAAGLEGLAAPVVDGTIASIPPGGHCYDKYRACEDPIEVEVSGKTMEAFAGHLIAIRMTSPGPVPAVREFFTWLDGLH